MLTLLFISVLTLTYNIQPVEAQPRTWTVDDDLQDYPGADFTKIQDAIDAATADDIIIVYPGTYIENVKVNKQHLTIETDGGAESTIVLAADSNDYAIEVTVDHVDISGFTVKGAYVGIYVAPDRGYCNVSNILALNNKFGIAAMGVNNTIENNEVLDNERTGIYIYNYYWNEVRNNTVSNSGRGIYLVAGGGTNLVSNDVERTCFGILIAFSTDCEIAKNKVIPSGGGGVGYDPNLYKPAGICLTRARDNVIRNNVISYHSGFALINSSTNVIKNNTVSNNLRSIYLRYSSSNTIFFNSFINNRQSAYSENSINTWNSPEEITYIYNSEEYTNYLGNYWSDYAGSDADGDGIGDTPYSIDGDSENYPLMELSDYYYPPPIVPEQPSQPINIEPADGVTDVSLEPTLCSSPPLQDVDPELIPWEEFDGFEITRVDSQWQITAVSGDYSAPVYDFTLMDGLVERYSFPDKWCNTVQEHGVLDFEITYYWRVRHRDFRNVWSPWSEETSFTTRQPYLPVADAGPDKSISSGDVVLFDGSNSYQFDGQIISYRWDFEDGETAEGSIVEHRFRGAMNEPKTYTVTLTVEDNYGVSDTDTTSVTVKPLEKLADVGMGLFHGVSCWMKVTYNWVGTDGLTGENFYIISKIDSYCGGLVGSYQLFILRRVSPPPSIPEPVWHIPLPALPILRTYSTPFTPSGWQEIWGIPCEPVKLTFPDGSFEGIGVTDTSYMWIVASGTEMFPVIYFDVGYTAFDQDFPIYHLKLEELKELWEMQGILSLIEKLIGILFSPGELRIYDSDGRIVGLFNGVVKEEIPGSTYVDGTAVILYPSNYYRYEVVGTEHATYGLMLISVGDAEVTAFTAIDIPTSPSATHEYNIDWESLSLGEEGVTVMVDSDGDGVFEHTFTSDSELSHSEYMTAVYGPVGGFWVPISKTELLAPWIGLVSMITVAVASIVYVKHRKKQEN